MTSQPPLSSETAEKTLPPGRHQGLLPGIFLFCLGTLTAALFAFVLYPHQNAVEARIDLNGFGILGRQIAWGHGFTLGAGPTIRRAPLYPAFVALLLTVFRTNSPSLPEALVYRPVLIVQCIILGLTCVTSWCIGRKLFGDLSGVVAGVLCAFAPQTLRYVGMTEVETLMGLLIALMALTGLNLSRSPDARNGFLFGLACGMATLVKPVAMLYPFAFLLLLFFRSAKAGPPKSVRPAVPGAVAALAVFVLCLAPWSVRNMIVSHGQFKSISSNAPGEFLRGYVNAQPKLFLLKQDFGGSDPTRLQWDWEANLYEDALLKQHGLSFFSTEHVGPNGEKFAAEPNIEYEIAKDRIEGAEARRRLLQEPLGVIRKFVIQVFTFWYIVETRTKSLLVLLIAAAAIILAVLGWKSASRRGIDVIPVASVVIYFNLLYALILAFARYSMPVYPTLLVLTAYGIVRLGSTLRGVKPFRAQEISPATL